MKKESTRYAAPISRGRDLERKGLRKRGGRNGKAPPRRGKNPGDRKALTFGKERKRWKRTGKGKKGKKAGRGDSREVDQESRPVAKGGGRKAQRRKKKKKDRYRGSKSESAGKGSDLGKKKLQGKERKKIGGQRLCVTTRREKKRKEATLPICF